MLREVTLHSCKRIVILLHNVVASTAVDMDVDEAGGENGVSKIYMPGIGRNRNRSTGRDGDDDTVLDHDHGMFNDLGWAESQPGCYDSLHSPDILVHCSGSATRLMRRRLHNED